MEIRRGEPCSVLGVDSNGVLVSQSHLLIRNGGPAGEMFRSLTLIGEFLVSESKHKTSERQAPTELPSSPGSACYLFSKSAHAV